METVYPRPMSKDPAFDRFMRRCKALTSRKTKLPLSKEHTQEIARAVIGGWMRRTEKSQVYMDDKVIVVRSLDSHAMVIEKRENKNQVIGRDGNGDVFRYHGEWKDIEDHVMSLEIP